jgi:hypothetical protein
MHQGASLQMHSLETSYAFPNHSDSVPSGTEFNSYTSHVDFGIDKSIFIKPKTFHLTVLMLKLWNKDHIAKASDVLQVVSF